MAPTRQLAEQLSTKIWITLSRRAGRSFSISTWGVSRGGRTAYGARGRPLPQPAVRQLQDLPPDTMPSGSGCPLRRFLRYLETVAKLIRDVQPCLGHSHFMWHSAPRLCGSP